MAQPSVGLLNGHALEALSVRLFRSTSDAHPRELTRASRRSPRASNISSSVSSVSEQLRSHAYGRAEPPHAAAWAQAAGLRRVGVLP